MKLRQARKIIRESATRFIITGYHWPFNTDPYESRAEFASGRKMPFRTYVTALRKMSKRYSRLQLCQAMSYASFLKLWFNLQVVENKHVLCTSPKWLVPPKVS